MLPIGRRTTFSPPPTALERALVPVVATGVASLAPLIPIVASAPLLPPFGLMTFVAWRLLRNEVWPLWIALPLGAWDDLLSGAPVGTAICGWTAILLALDIVDARLPWRGYRIDWVVGSAMVAAMLLFTLVIVHNAGSTPSPLLLVPQIALSMLLFPVVSRMCAMLDGWRMTR